MQKSRFRELVVISGKGGTGKTSLVASLAVLAGRDARVAARGGLVLADCDVDAADLHLILAPEVQVSGTFTGGHKARADSHLCTGCGICAQVCRFEAVHFEAAPFGHPNGTKALAKRVPVIDLVACEGCGACVDACPSRAMQLEPQNGGQWMVSTTRLGPLVHARLVPGEDNSGKLVTLVRSKASELAVQKGRGLLLVDGPPGIGCPVISSLTGASAVLAVAEPTVSGHHDLERVLDLTDHFDLPGSVVINKADLNPQGTEEIESFCRQRGVPILARVPFHPDVVGAMVNGKTIPEYSKDERLLAALQTLWDGLAAEFCS